MVFSELQSLGLGVILLFLLPGLAGMKTYLWETQRSDQFSRLDTIGISFIASLFALVLVYAGYWIYLGWPARIWSTYQLIYLDWPAGFLFSDAPLWPELKSHVDTVPEYIVHYAFLYVVTVAGGFALGRCGVGIGGDPAHRTEIWERHFKNMNIDEDEPKGNQVRLVTTEGDWIYGEVAKFGESANTRDLVLEDPQLITRDVVLEDPPLANRSSGDELPPTDRVREWQGRLYVHNRDIARVFFKEPGTDVESWQSDKPETSPDDETERLDSPDSADKAQDKTRVPPDFWPDADE
jgi:hypothetical protein